MYGQATPTRPLALPPAPGVNKRIAIKTFLFALKTEFRQGNTGTHSPVFLEHVGVRHHRRTRQDRLRRPQVLAETPWPLHRVHQLAPGLRAPRDLEPKHRPVDAVAVLRVRESLLGKARQPRIAYDIHLADTRAKRWSGGRLHDCCCQAVGWPDV